jgi:hypothetical protein
MSYFPYSVLGFICQSIFVMTAIRIEGLGKITDLEKTGQLCELLTYYYQYLYEVLEITKMLLEEIKADFREKVCEENGLV